jgi:hypothetical protein
MGGNSKANEGWHCCVHARGAGGMNAALPKGGGKEWRCIFFFHSAMRAFAIFFSHAATQFLSLRSQSCADIPLLGARISFCLDCQTLLLLKTRNKIVLVLRIK